MKKNKTQRNNLTNINVFRYGFLPWRYIPNWPKNIAQFFRNCKYAWQRITKGYCDQDIWSLDQHLTVLISNAVKELDKTRHSYPVDMKSEQWSEILQSISEHLLNSLEDNKDTEVSKHCDELWDKMASYELGREFVKCEDNIGYELKTEVSDEEAYEKAREEWLSAEKEAWEWREAEKDKALDILKKYFYSLWD